MKFTKKYKNIIVETFDRVALIRLNRPKALNALSKNGIEFSLGSAGGGNQLRQPYVRNLKLKIRPSSLKITDHIHRYGMYIGNYPELKKNDIRFICKIINESVS